MRNLDYGVIGNCKSAALVGKLGSIDWLCLPHFDSASVFASILDARKGGSFRIGIGPEYKTRQAYLADTNILVTTFIKGDDRFEVIDFMPHFHDREGNLDAPPEVVRYFRKISGRPRFRIDYNPRLSYGLGATETSAGHGFLKSENKARAYDSVYLYTSFNPEQVLAGKALTLEEEGFFLISYHEKLAAPDISAIRLDFEKTKVYWLTWVSQLTLPVDYRAEVIRSALVLKLLTYHKSGAVLAAVTTSLPETLGKERNWDYRFCWVRDASMIIQSFISLGEDIEAKGFLDFILKAVSTKSKRIQIVYGINGEKRLKETVLPHLAGYMGSKPVRIGNQAFLQKQNDIYGVLMEVILHAFLQNRHKASRAEELWTMVRSIVRMVEEDWAGEDHGIWEHRNQMKHFTFSKVLCWVAMDRAARIAGHLGKDGYAKPWTRLRDGIKKDILEKAWNRKLQAFTRIYGGDTLDASNLLMADYGFIDAKDPKYVKTVRLTRKKLMRNGLMYRYLDEDDFGVPTTSFTICTLWMAKSLFRIGERKEARKVFQRLLGYANHVGLLSEGLDFDSKRLLGNFPQGYSHLALTEVARLLAGDFTQDISTVPVSI